jgi:hypothetical protein
MTWRERITELYSSRELAEGLLPPRFHPPPAANEVAAAEARLGTTLPAALKSLWSDTDGVTEEMSVEGQGVIEIGRIIWPLNELLLANLSQRCGNNPYSREFPRLVFFAEAGCDGILFGFPVGVDGICESRVVVWHPIDDDLIDVAPSLDDFIVGWLKGTIQV